MDSSLRPRCAPWVGGSLRGAWGRLNANIPGRLEKGPPEELTPTVDRVKVLSVPPRLRSYSEVTGDDRSGLLAQVTAQRQRVRDRLRGVKHVVAVMSGKGGVGKSFVTAALAAELAR